MISKRFIGRLISVILLTCVTIVLEAQQKAQGQDYTPKIGQEGKDVIWAPTPDELVAKMLEIAGVTANDFLIDLGSGDGRTVIAAAQIGAQAMGIEYNPEMVALSKKRAEEAGVAEKTKFIQGDLFECDLSDATVITMFLLPELNLKLRPRLLDLKPGTRIVSNTFSMGDWEPDYEVVTKENWNSWNTALMWIIPAKIEGPWKLLRGELTIRQQYQIFYGTYRSGDSVKIISDGRLNGDVVSFRLGEDNYTGVVKGKNLMTGTITNSFSKIEWVAFRKE